MVFFSNSIFIQCGFVQLTHIYCMPYNRKYKSGFTYYLLACQLHTKKMQLPGHWFQVTPGAGIIKPDQVVDLSIHHEESHKLEEYVEGVPQSWWSEDTRDKELILLVIIRGSCSTESKTHRVNVRHCFSGNSLRIDSGGNASRRQEGSSHHRTSNTR